MHLLRQQRVEVQVEQGLSACPVLAPAPLSRAQRAHYRLDFPERLARNVRTVFGPVNTQGPYSTLCCAVYASAGKHATFGV